MTRKDLQDIIREEYVNVKLEEGVLSWASGTADNIISGILNNRADIMHTRIFDDPKLRQLAKDLKLDKKEFEKRVTQLLNKDNRFLTLLSTFKPRYK